MLNLIKVENKKKKETPEHILHFILLLILLN